MFDEFLVPDWGLDEIIKQDPKYYYDQWVELMKDGDCVIAIQKRKANAIGREMHSNGFANSDIHKTFNAARIKCGLKPL